MCTCVVTWYGLFEAIMAVYKGGGGFIEISL